MEPVEVSSKSSRKQEEEKSSKPRSRFAPVPIETSTKSSRKSPSPPSDEPVSPTSKKPEPTAKPARKFAPQLIDTSKRSRKSTDSGPTHLPTDKTDVVPGEPVKNPLLATLAAEISAAQRIPAPHELRRERSPFGLGRSNSRHSARSHSFRLPDLDTIESSESEHSNPPSLSTSPSSSGESPLTGSDVALSESYKHATRIRESVDENFSRYFLELEARRAEQKMQEQALAAFPNSDFHEPVAHYVDNETDSEEDVIDDRPATWEGHDDEDEFPRKRRSTSLVNWERREHQQHHEIMEQERRANGTTDRRQSTARSPWWNPSATIAAQDFADTKNDPELRQMQSRARPPMLGGDLRFPRSASPEPARFDVTQGSHQIRSQMCYLTEQAEGSTTNLKSADGLWAVRSPPSTKPSAKSSSDQGLWGGFCYDDGSRAPDRGGGLAPPNVQTGLLTPAVEAGNPFEKMKFPVPQMGPQPLQTPPTPQVSQAEEVNKIDALLEEDRELDELIAREFPDTFVTQVYNYLSLGYPSLARPFDEELSKISKISIKELRQDDELARTMPKGYIRLGDDFEGRGDGSDQELGGEGVGGCKRWVALKRYVREWARQEKAMVQVDGITGNWGTGARRGSWAW